MSFGSVCDHVLKAVLADAQVHVASSNLAGNWGTDSGIAKGKCKEGDITGKLSVKAMDRSGCKIHGKN
jgi:hypothetical protein